jgi:hypothetical protein
MASQLNPVRLQAENIDLRGKLDSALARIEKLQIIVMKTADVHVLADELDGFETDDEFFMLMKRKVRAAATEAAKAGKGEMVPMEEYENLDSELQAGLQREEELRTKIDQQAQEVRQAKADARTAKEALAVLTREVDDLKIENSVLHETVEAMEAEQQQNEPASPAAPPPPPPPPPLPREDPELQAKLRKALDAVERAEAEKKIAIIVKDRALKECGTALTENAKLQAIINGSRRGEDSAAQVALKARKEELDETRELLQFAERRAQALQVRIGDAENARLEASVLARELEAELERRSSGTASKSVIGQPYLIDLQGMLLPPQPPPRGDEKAHPPPPRSGALVPSDVDADAIKTRLLRRARAVPVEPAVLESAVASLQITYRRLVAELRAGEKKTTAEQHGIIIDSLLEKELQLHQLLMVMETLEATFGTRLATKESEAAAYYGRATAAEAKLEDLRKAAHGLHMDLADAVGRGGGGVALLSGAASPSQDASPGSRTATQASELLHKISELNGLLNSLGRAKPGLLSGTGAPVPEAESNDFGTPQRMNSENSWTATPLPPAASHWSPTAAKRSQMTADLVGRVRARQEVQRAKSLAAASPAMVSAKHAAQEMLAGYNTQRTMTSTLDNSVEERGRLDEAVKRAVPVAEHLQYLLMTPGQSSVAQTQAASPQPGATPQGAVGGDIDDRAAEELLATLIDRETEIARLQETAKAQSTLISLLKASTSGIGGGAGSAGSPWVGGAAISESGSPAFRGAPHADPRASHQLSDSDPMALSGPSLLEELALYKARASIMERRLEESLRRVTELEQQVVAMRFLAEEDTQAVRRRLQDAEQRAQDSLVSAAQREAERDRALATGTRLETALRRREAHLANSGLETAGEGDVASVPATPAGGGLLNQSQSFIAMDSDVFAKTMAKLRPRLKIDEATATTILAEAVQSYEQLLNQVAQNNKAKKEARQQTMDLGTSTCDSPGKPSSTTPHGDRRRLPPEVMGSLHPLACSRMHAVHL